uniref:Venom protein n=1 Tax=Panagrellus redivivus TaxID=6233 RepID=A0A7E4ZU21_PANRE
MAFITLSHAFIFIVFFISIYADISAADQTEACDNYATCLEKLEEKQRECREFRRSFRSFDDDLPATNKCSKKRNHELHSQITGLHLRKTEKTRDCVRKFVDDAVITVAADTDRKCRHQFNKLISAINTKPIKKPKNKKGGKKQRKIVAKRDERKCRRERKMLHRKCHKIATCCSLVPKCQKASAALLNQITNLKTTLKENRVQCKTRTS